MKNLIIVYVVLLIFSGCKSRNKTDINLSILYDESTLIKIDGSDDKVDWSSKKYYKCGKGLEYLIYDGELFTGILSWWNTYEDGSQKTLSTEEIYKEGKLYGFIEYNNYDHKITQSVTWGDLNLEDDDYDNCYVTVRKYNEKGEIISSEVESSKNHLTW
ncbi:MAG: hypothetical protein ACON4B_04985 [Flavobacteriaceae bacterium]